MAQVIESAASLLRLGKSRAKDPIRYIVVFILASVAFGIVLLAAGKDPVKAYADTFTYTLGNSYGRSEVLVRMIPLVLTAIAVALPSRLGLINIGGEGQLYMGAWLATWGALTFDGLPKWILLPLIVSLGFLSGALWAAISGTLRASRIGQMASDLLSSSGYSGKVLAVVSKAIYLSGPGGEILWLAHEVLPAHRRCIQAPFQAGGLRPGMEFWVQRKRLVLGNRVAVDLANAVVWEPSAIYPGQALRRGSGQAPPLPVVNTGFRRLLAALEPPETAKGLGQTIPLIAALASGSDHPPTFTQDRFVARALGPITRVARACLGRDMRRIAEESEQLVGLGPGLTPSGDDHLGGLLFAAHHLKAAYPTEFSWGAGPVLDFLLRARPLTNRISHTILSDCAQGHGPEPLHDLVNSLLQAEPAGCLLRSVDRLTRIGHTSGWDMLAGVLTAMLLTEANV